MTEIDTVKHYFHTSFFLAKMIAPTAAEIRISEAISNGNEYPVYSARPMDSVVPSIAACGLMDFGSLSCDMKIIARILGKHAKHRQDSDHRFPIIRDADILAFRD